MAKPKKGGKRIAEHKAWRESIKDTNPNLYAYTEGRPLGTKSFQNIIEQGEQHTGFLDSNHYPPKAEENRLAAIEAEKVQAQVEVEAKVKEKTNTSTGTSSDDYTISHGKGQKNTSQGISQEGKDMSSRLHAIKQEAILEAHKNRQVQGVAGRGFLADVEEVATRNFRDLNDTELYEVFKDAMKEGRNLTPDEFEALHLLRKTSGKDPTVWSPSGYFDTWVDKQKHLHGIVDQIADKRWPEYKGVPYKDLPDGSEVKQFKGEYLTSYGHVNPKGARANFWPHLRDQKANANIENLADNIRSGASMTRADIVDGIAKNTTTEGMRISQKDMDRFQDLISEYQSTFGNESVGSRFKPVRKYFESTPIWNPPSQIIAADDLLSGQVLDKHGNPVSRDAADRALNNVLVSQSNLADTSHIQRSPNLATNGIDMVTGSHVDNVPSLAELGPGGRLAATGNLDEAIAAATRSGDKIPQGKLMAMIKAASPDELIAILRKHPRLAQQMGHADIKLLAGLAAGAGISLAVLPLLDPENREAFINGTVEAAGKLGDSWQGMTDAGDEALNIIPGVEEARSIWDAYREATESGSTYRGGSGLSSLLPGVNTHINNVLGFVGEEASEAAGMLAKAVEIKDAGADSEYIAPVHQQYNFNATPQVNAFRVEQRKQDMAPFAGLLKNRWTNE